MYLILILVILVKLSLADKDTLPVFLIDNERVMKYLVVDPNPFSKMTTAYFADITQDCILQSDVIIIFVEDSFSVEDISSKDTTGSSFKNLHLGIREGIVKYFPRVIEPYQLLKQILKPQTVNTFYLHPGDNIKEIFNRCYKYFYVYFEDGRNETRTQALRRHDAMMREVLQTVRQKTSGAVIAFYTGKMNPVEKIEYVTITPLKKPRELSVLVESKFALYKFIGIYLETAMRTSRLNRAPAVANEHWTDNKLTTKLEYTDFVLEFNFSFKQDSWLLDEVGLIEGGEEVGRTKMGVGAPRNWAYYCGEPLVVINRRDGSSISIAEYQIQPFHKRLKTKTKIDRQPIEISRFNEVEDSSVDHSGDDDGADSSFNHGTDEAGETEEDQKTGKYFGQTVNCGPYFNVRILSGLFVSAICFGIMAFSMIFLFDCKTNNRFDNPHGKPLIIGTERYEL